MPSSDRGRFLFLVAVLTVSVGLGFTVAKFAANDHRATVAPAWPRVAHLRHGRTISVSRGGVVTERDRRGALVAVSDFEYCGVYGRWVEFMSSLKTAVQAGNRRRISDLVRYPLMWNHGGTSTQVPDRHSLLANYASIFDPSVVAAIERADPRALFCHQAGVMLGDGVAWGEEIGSSFATGRFVLVTINFRLLVGRALSTAPPSLRQKQ